MCECEGREKTKTMNDNEIRVRDTRKGKKIRRGVGRFKRTWVTEKYPNDGQRHLDKPSFPLPLWPSKNYACPFCLPTLIYKEGKGALRPNVRQTGTCNENRAQTKGKIVSQGEKEGREGRQGWQSKARKGGGGCEQEKKGLSFFFFPFLLSQKKRWTRNNRRK